MDAIRALNAHDAVEAAIKGAIAPWRMKAAGVNAVDSRCISRVTLTVGRAGNPPPADADAGSRPQAEIGIVRPRPDSARLPTSAVPGPLVAPHRRR